MGSRMPPFLLWSLLFLEAGNFLSVSLEQKYLVQPCWRYLKRKKKRNMSIHSRKLFLVNSRLQHATNTLFSCLFEKKKEKHKGKNWQTQFQSHDPVKFFTYFPPCLLQFFFHHRKKKSFERSFILLSLWHTSGNEKYQAFSHCNSEAINFQYWKSRQIQRLSHVTFFFLKKKKNVFNFLRGYCKTKLALLMRKMHVVGLVVNYALVTL